MSRQPDPRYLKRLVSRRLRELRSKTGRTQEDVAAAMDWSTSKVIRIENSTVGISTSDLKALMLEYGVENGEAAKLIDAAKASRQEPWYVRYGEAVDPALRLLLAYESVAVAMNQFQSDVLPGLLQTEDYARAVLTLALRPELVEPAVEARMERQRRLFGHEPWPKLHLVIAEHLLMYRIGGPEVTRGQLEHLVTAASRPEVSLSVVPVDTAGHPALGKSFTLLTLEDDADVDSVVYEESRGEEYLSNRDDELVRSYWSLFEQVEKVADTGEAAIAILNRHLSRTR